MYLSCRNIALIVAVFMVTSTCLAEKSIAMESHADDPDGRIYKYACTAASACIVTTFFGKDISDGKTLFAELGVNENGAALIEKLPEVLSKAGLKTEAFTGLSSWCVKNYLLKHGCVVIVVTDPPKDTVRHSQVLMPALSNTTVVTADLLTKPQIATDSYIDSLLYGKPIFIIVSDNSIPSPNAMYLKKYSYLSAISLALSSFAAIAMIRRSKAKRTPKLYKKLL